MKIISFITLSLLAILILSKPSYQASNYSSSPNNPPLILNPRLQNAYIALQALKHSIYSDPKNLTANWYGPYVCNYTGVYCAPAPDDNQTVTVAGLDLNDGNISGYNLPEDLGLLTDLALFHLNSNRFSGKIPASFRCLRLLFELDISNNNFSGEFPSVVLDLPSLKFLDIRFNQFHGKVPSKLFDLKLDAIFINDNKFDSSLPENFGDSPVSVIVLANNNISSCFPKGLMKMAKTLDQIILMNLGLKGCLPSDIGKLKGISVFDVSFNELAGELPESIGEMKKLKQLNVAGNLLSGEIPASICSLPKLENFTFSDNYFSGEPYSCRKLKAKDDKKNCIPQRPLQRSPEKCKSFYAYPVTCFSSGCSPPPPPPPPPPPHSPPPPVHHYYHKYP